MKYFILSITWALSLIATYYFGWFAGVKDAPAVAASSAHFMSSSIEYLMLALIMVIIAGAGMYFVKRERPAPSVKHSM